MFKIPLIISKFKTVLKRKCARANLFKIYLGPDFQFYYLDFKEIKQVICLTEQQDLYYRIICVGSKSKIKFNKLFLTSQYR